MKELKLVPQDNQPWDLLSKALNSKVCFKNILITPKIIISVIQNKILIEVLKIIQIIKNHQMLIKKQLINLHLSLEIKMLQISMNRTRKDLKLYILGLMRVNHKIHLLKNLNWKLELNRNKKNLLIILSIEVKVLKMEIKLNQQI